MGIQTKISLFIIVVVVSLLSVSTYVSRTLTEQKAEENLRERYINIVKQIDAGIVTIEELRDTLTLQEELAKLLKVRSNIVLIEIFDLTGDEIRIAARKGSEGEPPLPPPSLTEIEAIGREEVITILETRGNDRFWNIMAPIRIKKEVAGLIRARISTREYDALVSHERWQAFLVTAITAITILSFLVWYLKRTISKPIQTLISAMSLAEDGDLESHALVHSYDEIGKLTEQFNKMLQKIRNFNEDLKVRIKQATEELNKRYEELIKVNRRLSETQLQLAHSERLAAAGKVAAAMAHQIGTPLHSILGHIHRLKGDISIDKRGERLKIIESQIERIVQNVQELLNTVRKPDPKIEPVQINGILDDLVNLVMPGISSRGIKVITQFESQLPAITGDANQLQEAFLNLLTNAMDAMPNGGELHIITGLEKVADGSQEAVIITIRDSGCGISGDDLPKIFEPFFTTKENTHGTGTGIGLSICKDIIKSHGFNIQAFSRVEVGTTFVITMPVSRHEEA